MPPPKRINGHSPATLARKRASRTCIEFRCLRPAGPHKCRCNMHHARVWDARHPLRRSFINKRADAKRKGRAFTMTFKQWEKMAASGGLMERRGREGESMSVDRKDNDKGYTPGNSRVITKAENSAKGTKPYLGPHWRYLDEKEETITTTKKTNRTTDPGGDPF